MLKIRSDFFFLDIPGVSRGTLTFTTIALKTQYTPVSLKSSSGTSFQKLTTPEVWGTLSPFPLETPTTSLEVRSLWTC